MVKCEALWFRVQTGEWFGQKQFHNPAASLPLGTFDSFEPFILADACHLFGIFLSCVSVRVFVVGSRLITIKKNGKNVPVPLAPGFV